MHHMSITVPMKQFMVSPHPFFVSSPPPSPPPQKKKQTNKQKQKNQQLKMNSTESNHKKKTFVAVHVVIFEISSLGTLLTKM